MQTPQGAKPTLTDQQQADVDRFLGCTRSHGNSPENDAAELTEEEQAEPEAIDAAYARSGGLRAHELRSRGGNHEEAQLRAGGYLL